MKNSVGHSLRRSVTALAVAATLLPAAAAAQSLEQAVATALDTNPQIRQAFNRFKASEEQVNQASAGYYPTIDFDAGIGREWTESPSTRRDSVIYGVDEEVEMTRREIGVSLRQVLFSGFQTTNEVKRTEFEASAEQWTLYATAEDLALEVSRAYLEFLRAEQIVGLAQHNLESHQVIYGQVKQKTDSGLGSTADLSQVTGRLARAHSNLISAQNNLSDARISYQRIVNRAPEDTRIPVPDAVMLPTSLESAMEMAKASHPTLKAADNDINAAKAQRASAKGNYYPQVTFDLSASWDDNLDGNDGTTANPFDSPADVGGNNDEILAMVRVNYNLFSGGVDKAREREAAYSINESKAVRLNAYRDIEEGTTLAWNARVFLKQQMQYLRQHVEASTETRNAYEDQFKLGQRTLIDVLDSENELFQARREYLTAEYDDLIAQYRLLNATGQLLASLRVTTPEVWKGDENYEGGVK
ncbi:TolC family outer membrane protein [Grimontia marina]|uniref:Outer membrane efflux protein BepC n=1 Tax=Grimontia marina TaxID=646534 RepID=A0A128EY56_9GAMM|nr:TolC family outer membrane protein [Grimontia marina]CZF78961.1 Outer membrane efflux protein BepC precursor [Grimontia marina]